MNKNHLLSFVTLFIFLSIFTAASSNDSIFQGRVLNGQPGQVVVVRSGGIAVAKTTAYASEGSVLYSVAIQPGALPAFSLLTFHIDHRLVGYARLQPGTTQHLNLVFYGLPTPAHCSWWQYHLGLCKR